MICPICEDGDTQVTNTVDLGFERFRRLRCKDPECSAITFSREVECSEEEYLAARVKKMQKRKATRENRRAYGSDYGSD
jgi:hypothetical protein